MKVLRLAALLLVTSLSSCHIGRFFVYNFANITDHKIFPATELPASSAPAPFAVQPLGPALVDEVSLGVPKRGKMNVSQYLENETSTTAFLVIRNDSILYERYFNGYEPQDISTFFSVSKSITSLLVGIAVDEGIIESIDDPVTKYIPELRDAAEGFKRQTIRHLLNMRSGLAYTESYSNPFAPMAKLYYGRDQLGQIEKMDFREEPGTVHRYQSVSTAILGIVVEKASGMPLGDYLAQKVWEPLGMEYAASVSLDDKKHRSAKAYSGVNATARDLAKIGRLYLNKGMAGDRRIVSEAWIEASTTPDFANDQYQYQWYSIGESLREPDGKQVMYFPDSLAAAAYAPQIEADYVRTMASERKPGQYYLDTATDEYYAQGILNQLLYVDPTDNLIMVRLGKKWDGGYLWLFEAIREELTEAEGADAGAR
ncbi:serine hydrolase domain-containing protein [Neolewinella antarctica]|uniref:CubicO group peptidase (Beta-lactamase class C family) n=1 Tax=Neolewinella antarctica TaxID=442734 RepID=A0ABX0XA52_9BACT|nr:serine hydrolase [Neolewinella antarctica]NJC25925.1 CubicO group peptidase (beta-lactamase class C family) [Neolewinella antarctica]